MRAPAPLLLLLSSALALPALVPLPGGRAQAAPIVTQLDWDVQTWVPDGALGQTYTIGSGDVIFNWTGDTASLIQTRPQVGQFETGGLIPAQNSLSVRVNYPSSPREIQTTIDFTHPGGVTDVSFSVFDVDHWTFVFNPFTDQVQVTATDGVSTFNPSAVVITNPLFVTFDGVNTVTGIANVASSTSPDGNVRFTFNQPGLTQLTLIYRSPPGGPANPGQQYISIHDIDFTYDDPVPDLLVLKSTTTLEDPVNGTVNPKAIPGATVGYAVQITNTGPGAVDNDEVFVTDPIPGNAALAVTDYDGFNPGPVAFVDLVPASGLSYTFISLGSALDDVEFSNDGGATYTYTPSDIGDGTDPAVTHVRINPKGVLLGSGAGDPAFQVLFKIRVP
jgi:uncharacterized repeat protein (TIGR01451 family)